MEKSKYAKIEIVLINIKIYFTISQSLIDIEWNNNLPIPGMLNKFSIITDPINKAGIIPTNQPKIEIKPNGCASRFVNFDEDIPVLNALFQNVDWVAFFSPSL